MLYELREDSGMAQKEIARGIISVADLSRLECGEKEVDYIVLEALFQRLGKSIDKLELVVSGEDYRLLSLQEEIEESLSDRAYENVAFYLEAYKKYADGKKSIHKQYEKQVEAVSNYLEHGDEAEAVWILKEAITLTFPEWEKDTWEQNRLCTQEIRIMLMIAYIESKMGYEEEVCPLLERIQAYIEKNMTDEEERVKIYPHAMALLGRIYYLSGKISKAYEACQKGKACLRENGGLIMMDETLYLEESCLRMVNQEQELQECLQYREAICFLYELAGEKQETEFLLLLMQSSNQKEYAISNEMIRELRQAKGLSQEALSEDICAQETLARIEKGQRSPNKKNFYKLMDRMGVKRGTYYGYIESEHYYLYEMVRKYRRHISKGEKENAKEIFKYIENNLDLNTVVNQQFVESEHIQLQIQKERISEEDAILALEELLFLTMPPIMGKELVYRIPYRQEFFILNQIAICCKHSGNIKKALLIYEQILDKYKKGSVSMKHHAVPGFNLYTNYAGYLEDNNEIEKAENIGIEGLSHDIKCGRGDCTTGLLANLFFIYNRKGKQEVSEQILRNSIVLSELYQRKGIKKMCMNIYSKFGFDYDK